jgi:hypothetical protein
VDAHQPEGADTSIEALCLFVRYYSNRSKRGG